MFDDAQIARHRRGENYRGNASEPGTETPTGSWIERTIIMLQRILATFVLLVMVGTITGCNTMAGLGRDIERGGAKIQEKAAR